MNRTGRQSTSAASTGGLRRRHGRRALAWVGALGLLATTAVTGQAVPTPADATLHADQTVGSAQTGSGTDDQTVGSAQTGSGTADRTVDSAQTGSGTDDASTPDVELPSPDGVVGAIRGRLAGNDRYGSAVAISKFRFTNPGAVSTVYVARGDTFTDALTAGSLSDGPVLLTRGGCGNVPGATLAEVERLDPDRVIALGGTGAVCDQALQSIAQGRPTARIGGTTRQETAGLIARRAFPQGASTVYLTRGSLTPDAVVGGSLSDGPVLLGSSDGTGIPPATHVAIAALDPDRVIALGGTSAVTNAALRNAADGRPTGRLAGKDRYQTAIAVARHAYPNRTTRAYLARGDGENFVDAVVSGMLSDGPVLLTPGTCEPVRTSTASFLGQRTPERVVVLGGTNALCTSTLRGASLDARPAVDCAKTKCVALTFDDGPVAQTEEMMDIFAAERVPGTFFVVGKKLASRSDTTRRMWIEGHEIGNHTFDHLRLTELTLAQQQAQINRNDAAIQALGIPKPTLLRPPFLAQNTNTRRLGKAVIMNDTNPKDWAGATTQEIRTFIRNNVRPGSVVIQHDTMPNTVAAMPGILDDLHAAGYTIVTVPELLPNLRPGDLVYNRGTVYPLSVDVLSTESVPLDDGRVLEPMVDTTGPLTD